MLVTSVVAGIDTYQGMNCANKVGGYIQPFNSADPKDRQIGNALIAVPYGIVRGVIYNFGQSLNLEGTCGSTSYTMTFADGLTRLFNHRAPSVVYQLNQAILGAPGAMVGGVIAEEFHVFSVRPAKVVSARPVENRL